MVAHQITWRELYLVNSSSSLLSIEKWLAIIIISQYNIFMLLYFYFSFNSKLLIFIITQSKHVGDFFK